MTGFFKRKEHHKHTMNQQLNLAYYNENNWHEEGEQFLSFTHQFKHCQEFENKLYEFLAAKKIPFQINREQDDKTTTISVKARKQDILQQLCVTDEQDKSDRSLVSKLNSRFHDQSHWKSCDDHQYVRFDAKAYDIEHHKILAQFLENKGIPFSIETVSNQDHDYMKITARREDIANLLVLPDLNFAQHTKAYHPYDKVKLDSIIEEALTDKSYRKPGQDQGEIHIEYPLNPSRQLQPSKLRARLVDFCAENELKFKKFGAHESLNIVIDEVELAKYLNKKSPDFKAA